MKKPHRSGPRRPVNAGRSKPETLRQARTWDGINRSYVAAGLCFRCAAQAAWGHQIGFNLSHPPCETCAPIVATLPEPKSNGWRSAPRGRFSDGPSAPPSEDTRESPGRHPATPVPAMAGGSA